MSHAFAFLIACGVASSTIASPPPAVYTDEPPKEVNELIGLLKQGERRVIKRLSELDFAAPYLRGELQAASSTNPQLKRNLAEALAPINDRIYERNKNRYAVWAKTGRLDLCAEFLVECERKDGFILADLTIPFRARIGERFIQAVKPFPPADNGKRGLFTRPTFKLSPSPEHDAAAHLTILPLTTPLSAALIRADRCKVQVPSRDVWFVAVRTELRDDLRTTPGITAYSEWFRSVVLVNNSITVQGVAESLIICDGDVELTSVIERSVVIANGNIGARAFGGGRNCYFAATGNITFPKHKETTRTHFHAGGTVTLAEGVKPTDRIREGQKSLPFGARFLETEEFGLALTGHKDGVSVNAITKASLFAKSGIEVGDLITSIDTVNAKTDREFRQQLRVGIMTESVVLEVLRKDQILTRIIYLDGVPLPIAPMPHNVKP